jgi:hypothetical protein
MSKEANTNFGAYWEARGFVWLEQPCKMKIRVFQERGLALVFITFFLNLPPPPPHQVTNTVRTHMHVTELKVKSNK